MYDVLGPNLRGIWRSEISNLPEAALDSSALSNNFFYKINENDDLWFNGGILLT